MPDRTRNLYGAPLSRLFGEALTRDGMVLVPPADNAETARLFFEGVLRTRNEGWSTLSGGGSSAFGGFLNVVGQTVIASYYEIPDSLSGIMPILDVPNFLLLPIVQSLDVNLLKPVGKGGTSDLGTAVFPELGQWKLTRYGKRLAITETAIVDDQPGLFAATMKAIAQSAKRMILDRAWFTILSNPVLPMDGNALFSAAHSNYSSSNVLTNANLQAATAAIRNQTLTQPDGTIQFLNLEPRFLLVPPQLEDAARETLRLQKLDDPKVDLQLRIESRMGGSAVSDPLSGQTASGSATNWLVACDSSNPFIVGGKLAGSAMPTIRWGEARPGSGMWGVLLDVAAHFACAAIDWRPGYFSAG